MKFDTIDGHKVVVALPNEEWERIKSLTYKHSDLHLVNAISETAVAKERNPASMNSINNLWRRANIPYRLVGHPKNVNWSNKCKVVRMQRLSDWIQESVRK